MTTIQTENRRHISLEETVRQICQLPSLPALALDLLNALEDEEASLDLICEKVALDPALAASTIMLANSSHYRTDSKVISLHQAVAVLGILNVKNLIRLTIFKNSFPHTHCQGFIFNDFWKHSLATAICAELIARTLHLKHDFAFTAGLLHDIGRLVLVSRFPEEYAQVIACQHEQDCALLDAERAVMGVDHVVAGLALAEQWHFSLSIQDAIHGHHQPDSQYLSSVAAIVHVANSIVCALDLVEDPDALVPEISALAWDTLALSETDYGLIFHETELRFEAMIQGLNLG